MVTIDLKNKATSNICLLCTKEVLTQRITSIFQNTQLINLLSRGIGINIEPNPAYPDTVCIQCVMTVNIYLDFQNRIKRNLMKLRLNHCAKTGGDMSKVRRYKNEINPTDNRSGDDYGGGGGGNGSNSSREPNVEESCDAADSGVGNATNKNHAHIDDDEDENDDDGDDGDGDNEEMSSYIDENVIGINNSPIPVDMMENQQQQQYGTAMGLLEPMYSTSENLSDTESGGNLHVQNHVEYNRRRRQNNEQKLQCSFCPKIYRRPYFYKKHLRKHTAEQRNRKHESQLVAEQQHPSSSSSSSSSQRPTMTSYVCTNCPEIFPTMHLLRKHLKIHDKQMECPLCKMKFVLKNDFSWHIIECAAIYDARTSNALTADDNHTEKYVPKIGRNTRSRGLAVSIYTNEMNDAANDGGDNDDDHDDLRSVCSSSTTKTDPMYNERQSYTKSWSENLINMKKKPTKRRKLSIYSELSYQSSTESDFTTSNSSDSRNRVDKKAFWKRRRVEKKRARKIGVDYYNCSFENCEFGCLSLSETMLHEVKHHNVLLLHFCNECKEWFSTREHLIRHRKRHETFIERCSNCNQHFDNKYDLEHHLMLHHEKSFPCRYCNMSFLKESEHERHMLALHKNEQIIKHGIVIRKDYLPESRRQKTNTNNNHLHLLHRPHRVMINKPLFEKYKTKYLVQNNYNKHFAAPAAAAATVYNGTERITSAAAVSVVTAPLRKKIKTLRLFKQQKQKLRVGAVSHYHRKRLGNASGIRKPGVNMCNEYFEYVSDLSVPFVSARNDDNCSGDELDIRNCLVQQPPPLLSDSGEASSTNGGIIENNSETNNFCENEPRLGLSLQTQHQIEIPFENGMEYEDEEEVEVLTCFKEEETEEQTELVENNKSDDHFYFNKNEFNLFSTDFLQSASSDEEKLISLDSKGLTTSNQFSIADNENKDGDNDEHGNIGNINDYQTKFHGNSNVNNGLVKKNQQQQIFEQPPALENSWGDSLTVVLMSDRQRKRAKKLQISENAPMAVIDSSCRNTLLPKSLIQKMQY